MKGLNDSVLRFWHGICNIWKAKNKIRMDKQIPAEQRRKEALKRYMKLAALCGAIVCVIVSAMFMLGTGVKRSELMFSTAERGDVESTVSASGRIVPLYEQAIVSPVTTRILEVYCNEGDSVEAGESLLRLDLLTAEADYQRVADEVSMKRNELEQTALDNATYLTDLEMRVKVKEMSLSHLKVNVINERRLDSIGSGTGDRIRQAELAYSTAQLELEQLRKQLANEKKSHAASYRSKQLEGSISSRNLQSMMRTLDEARIKAPRNGIVTWLNKSLGASIGSGEKLAVVSDLSHFKIEGEIPESSSGKLAVGSPVNVKINRDIMRGRISTISPQSTEGMVSFTVILEDDSNSLLRSGLRVSLNVVYDVHESAVRIANGSYYQGPGTYRLFVLSSDNRLEKRQVTLGDSNFDFVEVTGGLEPGEQAVITDMSAYQNTNSLKIKN